MLKGLRWILRGGKRLSEIKLIFVVKKLVDVDQVDFVDGYLEALKLKIKNME